MTDSELRALAEAATEGPWEVNDNHENHEGQVIVWSAADDYVCYLDDMEEAEADDLHNANFIAAVSPDVLIGLLDRLAAAEKVVEAARDSLRELITAMRLYSADQDDGEDGAPWSHIHMMRRADTALAALDGEAGK